MAQVRGALEVAEVDLEVAEVAEADPFSTVLGSLRKRRKYTNLQNVPVILLRVQSKEDEDAKFESSEEEELASQDESSSDEDEIQLPTVRPYAALMQSLAAESRHQPKRRKLEHVQEAEEPMPQENEVEQPETEAGVVDVDHVEEVEEGPETATDGLLQDDEDLEDASDPFEAHFANPDDNLLSKRLKALQENQWSTQKVMVPKFGKAVINLPQSDGSKPTTALTSISGPEELKLKQKLKGAVTKQRSSFDALEMHIAPLIFNYQDVLFCERRTANAESLRRLACLHAVNHVFKLVSLLYACCASTNGEQNSRSCYQEQCPSCKGRKQR